MKPKFLFIPALAICLTIPAATLSAAHFDHPANYRSISERELEKLIEHLQSATNDFDDDFADALDNYPLDGTDEEDRLENQVEALEDTFDEMQKLFRKGASDAMLRELAGRALAIGADLNRVVLEYRLKPKVEADWDHIRSDLNGLAQYFGIAPLTSH